jgi:hypothetical protein
MRRDGPGHRHAKGGRGPDAVRRGRARGRRHHRTRRHRVEADLEPLGAGRSPEAFVRDCFAFLLEREPKESILSSFDVGVIGRYFPEFERLIARR